jgi:hypothetical protein
MATRKCQNKPARRFTGELGTPIYEPVSLGDTAEARRRAFEQVVLKLEALFRWYSIDPDEPGAGMELAAILALTFVPGMRIIYETPKRRGRKRSWKDGLAIELVRDVDALQKKKKVNIEQAIEELRQEKKGRWSSYTQGNLLARHREARNADRQRRLVAEQLGTSTVSGAMGAVFGLAHPREPPRIQTNKISRRRKLPT